LCDQTTTNILKPYDSLVVGMLLNSSNPATGIVDVHVMDKHVGRAAVPYSSVTGNGMTFTPADFIARLAVISVGGGHDGLTELLRVLYQQRISIFAFLGHHILPLIYLPGAAPALFELILHCTNWTGVVNMDALDQSLALNLGATGPDDWKRRTTKLWLVLDRLRRWILRPSMLRTSVLIAGQSEMRRLTAITRLSACLALVGNIP
jgi:hypothetical protein